MPHKRHKQYRKKLRRAHSLLMSALEEEKAKQALKNHGPQQN
jgi:hypothetical protein